MHPLTEYESELADKALDKIEGVAALIVYILDGVTRYPGINVSQVEWERQTAVIEEAIGELFHNERQRFMEIAGWRPEPKSTVQRVGPPSELFRAIQDITESYDRFCKGGN